MNYLTECYSTRRTCIYLNNIKVPHINNLHGAISHPAIVVGMTAPKWVLKNSKTANHRILSAAKDFPHIASEYLGNITAIIKNSSHKFFLLVYLFPARLSLWTYEKIPVSKNNRTKTGSSGNCGIVITYQFIPISQTYHMYTDDLTNSVLESSQCCHDITTSVRLQYSTVSWHSNTQRQSKRQTSMEEQCVRECSISIKLSVKTSHLTRRIKKGQHLHAVKRVENWLLVRWTE